MAAEEAQEAGASRRRMPAFDISPDYMKGGMTRITISLLRG